MDHAPTGDAFAPGLLARLPAPRRVALVRVSRLGDFICATPAFRALRAALPEAEITLIGLPFARELVARSRQLDRFAPFPGFPGMAEQFFDARRAAAFLRRMQRERFDLAVQMHGSGVYSNPFTLLLGARATAGFVRPGDPSGRLDAALPLPDELPEIERLLALVTFLGAPAHGATPEYPLWPADHAAAERLLARLTRPLIGLHPAARHPTKRWPPERFAAVGTALVERFGGTVVVLGGRETRPLAEAVAAQVRATCRNLAGRTGLGSLGAVVARLAVLVTNDTGPAHIAYALGTPTATVFGGTDPAQWGPPDGPHRVALHPVACLPCEEVPCPVGYSCLAGVTVGQVVETAEAVWRPAEPG